MKFAENALKKGGRLVFLYPVDNTIEKEEDLFPKHENFDLKDYSECPMANNMSRYVLTY